MSKVIQSTIPISEFLKDGESGVYAIINSSNLKLYIGSSKNLMARRRSHRYELEHGKHRSSRLQLDFDSNNQAFEFVVIERCDVDFLLEREQFWMDFYKSYNSESGYNSAPKAGTSTGVKWSDEQRAAKSRLHTGREQPHLRKPIIQMDLNGVDIQKFNSIFAASRALGFTKPVGNLVSAMNGKQKTAYGFKWRYA